MGDNIEVQLVLKNQFGEFLGKKSLLTSDQYQGLINMSKLFYNSGGFELTCEDGTFVVFPPDVVKQSILQVKVINYV